MTPTTSSEPGQRLNELHSLLGTEVAHLSPALERYSHRYFHDRQGIVSAFQSYDNVFTDLAARHDALKTQLDRLHAQLDATREQLDAAGAQADSLSSQIRSLRAQGRIAQSNSLVGAQNDAIDRAGLLQQYNSLGDRSYPHVPPVGAREPVRCSLTSARRADGRSVLPGVWSFMLALRSRGLGSAWTTIHLYKEREMAELLGIPYDSVTQAGLFPVAYTVGTELTWSRRYSMTSSYDIDMPR